MSDSEQGKSIISTTDDPDSNEELYDAPAMEDAGELRDLTVPVTLHGERLDRALAVMVPEFSRSYLQQVIASGLVRANGVAICKSSARIKAFDLFQIELRPTPQSNAFRPEPMDLEDLEPLDDASWRPAWLDEPAFTGR